ncbi:hypothetical protein [Metabacillus arenae]|uniref:Uncharacterized protein n=1 Tax=Metabacillus arenae TaxID=2771434 RepID=A0A926S1L2_9BACI|nr:hypothetical protein [Metabacillus arenae]MBD1381124.1 hypothetical protein [Metabacillus arenae]
MRSNLTRVATVAVFGEEDRADESSRYILQEVKKRTRFRINHGVAGCRLPPQKKRGKSETVF